MNFSDNDQITSTIDLNLSIFRFENPKSLEIAIRKLAIAHKISINDIYNIGSLYKIRVSGQHLNYKKFYKDIQDSLN